MSISCIGFGSCAGCPLTPPLSPVGRGASARADLVFLPSPGTGEGSGERATPGSYWHASQSGLSIEQALGTSAAPPGAPPSSSVFFTRLRRPSLMVDFSVIVAAIARR